MPVGLGWGWSAGVLVMLLAGGSAGDVFMVNTNGDASGGSCIALPLPLPGPAGRCSLRDAINAARDTAGNDLIVFDPTVFVDAASKLITLSSSLPDIAGVVEINAVSPPLQPASIPGIIVRASTGVSELFRVAAAGSAQLDDVALEDAGLTVASGASIVFAQTVDASYAKSIGGEGSVVKQGSARLILTGSNSYSGTTSVKEGALQGDTLSIRGNVSDAGLLVFDQQPAAGQVPADPEAFDFAISGTGRVQKIGAGTLFLTKPNTYAGGTLVSEGVLKGYALANGTGSLQGNIQNEVALVFDQQQEDGTFGGALSGTGRVEKTGPQALELTGSNRYTGGTRISEGILLGDADAIQGNIAIAGGAQLVFVESGSGTHSGDITGGGGLPGGEFSLEKAGGGTLTLTGRNAYDGGTLVSGGILRGDTDSLQGDITLGPVTAPTPKPTLVFDQAFAGAFTGLLAGDGALEKSGGGTLVLTRDLGGFSGDTTIFTGRLDVGRPGDGTAARLPGDVDIRPGASLGGIGSIGGLATADSGAAISPGNSIGTLSVGSVVFHSGSFLDVEVTPAPSGDLLHVGGAATIDPGARVRVIPGAGDYPDPGLGTPVTILEAGSIGGQFDPISPDAFAFLSAVLNHTTNQVTLTVESNGKTLSNYAATANQSGVAGALETARAGGDPDLATVFGELNRLAAADVPDALDAMAGEQLTQFATARLAVGQRLHGSIQERIRGAAGRESGALFAGGGSYAPVVAGNPLLLAELPALNSRGPTLDTLGTAALAMQDGVLSFDAEPGQRGLGGWLDGYGIFGDISGGSGTDDFDTTIWGVSAGLDTAIGEGWIAGAAGGYAHSDLDFDTLDGDPEVHTGQGAAYLGYTSPLVEAGAAFRFAWNRMSLDRSIAFAPPSTLARSADSDVDGIDLGGHLEGAVNLFEFAGVSVQPVGSFTYTHLEQDGFDEAGAGSLDIAADDQSLDSLVSGLGARFHGLWQLDREVWVRPELRVRWLHEFGDRERKLDARIGGLPGATYTVRGAELPRDSGAVGIGWTVVSGGRLHFFAEYDLIVNPDLLQHSAALGFKVVW